MPAETLDIQIVTWRPEPGLLDDLIASLIETPIEGWTIALRICENSVDPDLSQAMRELVQARTRNSILVSVDFVASEHNRGFGGGHNLLLQRGTADYVLLLNQDVVLEPGALQILLDEAIADNEQVAAWEMRQIPYEHPKSYDPATGDAPWVSGAAVLWRGQALREAGGFEPRIFMYGEDVDLSWRLRAKGWRLRYVARAAVQHLTYNYPEEIKRNQVLGGTLSNLLLRARFGTWRDIAHGIMLICGELFVPQAFPGRRLGLLANLAKFVLHFPYFRLTKVSASTCFAPEFRGWNYELRRDGAFHVFHSKRRQSGARPHQLAVEPPPPLVSILIRTCNRPAWLRHALSSVAAQTYRPLEVVVVEDGPPDSQPIVAEFASKLDIRYHPTGDRVGRSKAGNIALGLARGDYLNFLDDDDLLFADHVEVLVDAARQGNFRAAYGLAWETHTDVVDTKAGLHREVMHITRHRQPFNRVVLWHHNYLPIQVVLFERSLFLQYGGFDPQLDQLEDWNLWTRFALADDFVFVPKTTSKYRVPANTKQSAARQSQLDAAYQIVKAKQAQMRIETTPFAVSAMVEDYLRNESLIHISKTDVRRWVAGHSVLRTLASYRGRVMRRLRARNSE
ncbi:MAG: glycosyltransferase [Betaproteobacteria bacterium]